MASKNILELLDANDIANVVEGKWLCDFPKGIPWKRVVRGYPPRKMSRSDFVIGPTIDGIYNPAEYLDQYAAAGCAAVMLANVPTGLKADLPVLEVKRMRPALLKLASLARSKVMGRVFAVTGSSGKTTMKNMLAHVLSAQGTVSATPGTGNNLMAICYQMINARLDANHYVFESGLGAIGSGIGLHSSLLQPHAAVITALHPAHAEGYPSVDAIVRSKMAICRDLQPDGYLLIDRDSEYYGLMLELAATNRVSHVITFGLHPEADVSISAVGIDAHGTSAQITVGGVTRSVKLGIYGKHWMKLAAAVLGICHVMGLDIDQAVRDLRNFQALIGRGWVYSLPFCDGQLLIFDSHFNANPGSMKADLDAFAAIAAQGRHRCIGVIGSMRELGDLSIPAHRALAEHLNTLSFAKIFLVGEETRPMRESLKSPTSCYFDPASLPLDVITGQLQPDDFVFIKGSHSNHLDRFIKHLSNLAAHVK